MRFNLPGSGPDLGRALGKWIGQKLSRPLWLWGAATAGLPTTPETGANEGAIAYDDTRNVIVFRNATGWVALAGYDIATKTATYTETATAGIVIAFADLAGGLTVTLPAALSNTATLTYKNLRAGSPLTIRAAGSDTIDDNTAIVLGTQYAAVTLVSDGVDFWGII